MLQGCADQKYTTQNVPPVKEENEDTDVKEERERVKGAINENNGEDMILVDDLVKKYERTVEELLDKEEKLTRAQS